MNAYKVTGTYRNATRTTLYTEQQIIVAGSIQEATQAFGSAVVWQPSRHVEVRSVVLLHESVKIASPDGGSGIDGGTTGGADV